MADATEDNNLNADSSMDDDWAAAMAEQALADSAAPSAQPAQIFPSFGEDSTKASMLNELDRNNFV